MALSRTQSVRLGTLISVMFKDATPDFLLKNVVDDGFVEAINGSGHKLTDKGLDEKNRLCTLAGLNIKYLSERRSSESSSR